MQVTDPPIRFELCTVGLFGIPSLEGLASALSCLAQGVSALH